MGTRSLTHFIDEQGVVMCTMYRQYDGYIMGHGLDLATALTEGGKDVAVVNGYGATDHLVFNGMRDAAAQVICAVKHAQRREGNPFGIGNVYMDVPGSCDVGEEFTYELRVAGERQARDSSAARLSVRVYDGDRNAAVIFEGSPAELLKAAKRERAQYERSCKRRAAAARRARA